MSFNFDLVIQSFPLLLLGAGITIKITALSVGLGMIIGMFVGIARISHVTPLRMLAAVYIDFLRGTPLLVQIFLIYFALPLMLDQRVDPFVAAITACGINSGAYVAEIIRAGIMSVDNGQFEAGRSLGFNYVQTMLYIIIPQMVKNVLPALCNEFIVLIKETSIAGYIGIMDLTKAGDLIRGRTFSAYLPLLGVAFIYLMLVLILTHLVGQLERRLRVNER